MSSSIEAETVKKILETFVAKADQITTSLIELRGAIANLTSSQGVVVQKLDDLRLDLRELATRIEMAVRK